MASKSSSRTLTDHEEIRQWAEERGAKPSAVKRTESDDDVGIIRLDFPGYSGEGSLEEIEWDEWFDKFEDSELALVVQDETANGQKSNFNKLVSRDSVENYSKETSEKSGRSTSARSSRAKKSGSTKSKSSGKSASGGSTHKQDSGTQAAEGEHSRHKSRKKAA